MPAPIQNVILGALKLLGIPERACFQNWQQFVEAIPQYFAVEVPQSITNVIVGSTAPSEDDRDKIWYRRDNNGSFLGVYAFQNGAWRPFYSLVPDSVTWTWGNSNSIPDGFILIEQGDSTIPSTVVNFLVGQYIPLPSGPGYQWFAIRFVGY